MLYLDGAHVRGLVPIRGGKLLRVDGNVADIQVGHKPVPHDLDDVDGRADGSTPGLDQDFLLPAFEQGHSGKHVVQDRFPSDENGVGSRHIDSSK